MKPRIFYILIVFVISCSCNKSKDLSEKEVYALLNEIIKDDSLKIEKIDANFLDLPLNSTCLNEFSLKDKKFIKEQYEKNRIYKVDTNKIKRYKLQRQVIIINGNDTSVFKGLLRISYPYISIDRKKVLIIMQENSDIFLGGKGGAYLYIKENVHWKRAKTINNWIN